MKIAIAQINPTIGDIHNNCQKILEYSRKAQEMGAQILVFPELSLIGYPPKDLILRRDFLEAQIKALEDIADATVLPVIVGAAVGEDYETAPYNAAVLCAEGIWRVITRKCLLPNYNVFDEKRYFRTPEKFECQILMIHGKKLLVSICEDAWGKALIEGQRKYFVDPIECAIARHGKMDAIINMSASPYTMSKPQTRMRIFSHLGKAYCTTVFMVNQVGANDQLLFDGQSMIIDKSGRLITKATSCVEEIVVFDLDSPNKEYLLSKPVDNERLLLEALTMGIRDYVEKCRMSGVIVGVSGGIDSAVCLALAVRALGSKRVRAIFLPSQFTSEYSRELAKILTKNLDLHLEELSIEDAANAVRHTFLKQHINASESRLDIYDQNLQSRLRGLFIMAISNLSDYLMLTTSNKSELSVGYSTIYGDMCGAFSPIGDLYKTKVWQLAHTINRDNEIIPNSLIERPPTAELKPNQLDTDSLPDFHILDQILFNYIELERSADEIEQLTHLPRKLIDEIIDKIAISEYKRRQAPFPLMVSDKAFGDARRLPIAKRITGLIDSTL